MLFLTHLQQPPANYEMEAMMQLTRQPEWLQQAYPGRYDYMMELAHPLALNNSINMLLQRRLRGGAPC